ncbi:MAG: protein-disulfide reductase DsbD family protein [Candidatus Hydrogenedentes bacterium]|nr:protein-disulfide reductase DsbD family protein [Candidatus Hydrogenedentota bacterium]
MIEKISTSHLRALACPIVLGAAFLLTIAAPLSAQQREYVQAELVADVQTIEPGKPFRLGLLFKLPPHAHIYWRFPGSSGLPTSIEWTLPEGFTVGKLQWPGPERFDIEEIDDVTYGYESEVLLFANVTPPATFNSSVPVTLAADASWLVCLESGLCIPEFKSPHREFAVGEARPSNDAAVFTRYASHVPVPLTEAVPVSLSVSDGRAGALSFEARAPWRFALGENDPPARFSPRKGGPWDLSIEVGGREGGAATLKFQCSAERPGQIAGVAALPMENSTSGEKRTFYIFLNPS